MTSRSVERGLFLALCAIVAGAVLVTCGTLTPREGWNERWGPLVPHESFPADCSLCHLPDRWDRLRPDFSYDHGKETGHPLRGAHEHAACLRCHNDFGPVQAYVARGCAGCHLDVHEHQLGAECTLCHDEQSWRPGGLVAEHARTRFPLFGTHAAVACELCHVRAPTGDYRGAPTQCEFCHQDDLSAATSPDHRANGWTTRCERCHFPTTWTGAGFNHNFFPLQGGHAIACSRCHLGGTFGPLPRDCYSCHQSDYESAPNHLAFAYPQTCQSCHSVNAWRPASFRHRFPLSGPHRVDCSVCHPGGASSFTCLVCHQHNQTDMDAKHREVGGYRYDSQACYQCHANGRGDD